MFDIKSLNDGALDREGRLPIKIDAVRLEQISAEFQNCFRAAPAFCARAPGRVDLMGSHTDYNLGCVLTLAIGRETWIAARPREDRRVRLYSRNIEAEDSFSLDCVVPAPRQAWSNYVRGVASVLQHEGFALRGFDGFIHSTVPMSSGLSSSAALECAAASVFEALDGWKLDPIKKALLCQRAENQFVGVNCGILDQFTSCAGRAGCALFLDCRDLSSRPVKLGAGIRMVICDTKSKRELAGSAYGQRRAQCEEGARRFGVKALREITLKTFNARQGELPPDVAKRCRFIIEENDRVPRLAKALTASDRRAIQQLAADSFRGACDLYEICAPSMHLMMKAMLAAPGAIGARQAGAGFGGCMVAFVEEAKVDTFAAFVREAYFAAARTKAEVYPVDAVAGAGLLPTPNMKQVVQRQLRSAREPEHEITKQKHRITRPCSRHRASSSLL
jgi:galactokinase